MLPPATRTAAATHRLTGLLAVSCLSDGTFHSHPYGRGRTGEAAKSDQAGARSIRSLSLIR